MYALYVRGTPRMNLLIEMINICGSFAPDTFLCIYGVMVDEGARGSGCCVHSLSDSTLHFSFKLSWTIFCRVSLAVVSLCTSLEW